MHKKYHILYVEDDAALAFVTKDNLEIYQFSVTHFATGEGVLESFAEQQYDVCILDIMVPGKDGFELAAAIRKINNEIPIIFLSAKTLKEDRIRGLKLGADDYLVKPFSIEELVLKIEVFLQRPNKRASSRQFYTASRSSFDAVNYEVLLDGEKTALTQREAALLTMLMQNANKVLKREEILLAIWGADDYFMGRSLDVFISRLRKILAKDTNIIIENLHGIGFRFTVL